jgi:glycosyltransferase involved in cell wall biosynthesis
MLKVNGDWNRYWATGNSQGEPDRVTTEYAITAASKCQRQVMELRGINILVDGYNLELREGTGVKTYGLTLIAALRLLGANVGVLGSKRTCRDPIINEVQFFDRPKDPGRLDILTDLLRAVSRVSTAREVRLHSDIVHRKDMLYKSSFGSADVFYNLPGCFRAANSLFAALGMTTVISVDGPVDIWHATYPIPLIVRGAKTVITIHDLIPLRLPYTTLDNKRVFYKSIKDALRRSKAVIAVSENTKRDILSLFQIDPQRIHVTYQPILLDPVQTNDHHVSEVCRTYGLDAGDFLLFVGAIEPKKNVGRLIRAYVSIDTKMPLVLVGKKAWMWEAEFGLIEALPARDRKRIRLLDHVPLSDLRYLYAGAHCFVFPSLYEGFGLPPLEAMSCGCPVITSNVSSLPEVCGDAARYVDPYEVHSIRQEIEKLLGNPLLRNELALAGRERAKLFNMENYVKRLSGAYSDIL